MKKKKLRNKKQITKVKPKEKNTIIEKKEIKKDTGIHVLQRTISKIFPSSFIKYIDKLIIESDEDTDTREYLGIRILKSLAIGILVFIISQVFTQTLISISFGFIIFILFFIWAIVRLMLKANQRATDIEKDLPEILQMISANMRAGMTVERAVTETVWPEFGILGKEINKIKIRLHTGKSFSEAFDEMSRTIRSENLKRSVKLLIEGNKLGGEMAQLLYDVSKNLKETRELKEQIKSATTAYAIFILLGAVIITPVLFSISAEYSTFTEKISMTEMGSGVQTQNEFNTGGSMGISGLISLMGNKEGDTKSSFNSETIELFSLICIAVISISSSFILATIRAEKTISGIKYIPFALGISYLIYFVSRFALSFVMGSLVTGFF
ncbi:MAG: type II secretion system F family protein [Candidatus Micrarchaeia archaeon]|jgi:flagellar protein FlaJ